MPAAFRAGVVARGLADAGAALIDSNSFTVQAGDTCLVFVGNSDGSPLNTNSALWDPAGANQSLGVPVHTASAIGTFGRFNFYLAQGLTPGTGVFRGGWSGNQGERIIGALAYTGVDTTTPIVGLQSATNTNTTFSVTANPTTPGQLVVGLGYVLDINGPIPDPAFNAPNGAERGGEGFTVAPAYDSLASQDITAAGATQALTWTLAGWTAPVWYGVAFALNDAVTTTPVLSGPGTRPRLTLRPRPFAPGNPR